MGREFAEYVAHGWKLCPIAAGEKAPTGKRWSSHPISAAQAHAVKGAGLLHALSGTCALDVDSMTLAQPWLAARGVNIQALLADTASVRIESGRPDRTKLLYALPTPLRTFKPTDSGVELRCATSNGTSVQDVLPPSVHPLTKKPYHWTFGSVAADWRELPMMPPPLLELWNGLTRPTTIDTTAPVTGRSLDDLRRAVAKRNPDGAYDDWLKVGMALHHESGGSAEGFAVWLEWSQRGTKYKDELDLRAHWLSFETRPGKRVVTGGAILAEDVATADEFDPIEPPAAAAPASPAGPVFDGAMLQKKAEVIKMLETRLVYVRSYDRYLDVEHRDILASDHAIQHRFQHEMPRRSNGRVDPVKLLRESTGRTMVHDVAFHPGAELLFRDGARDFANTYRPLPLELLEPTKKELDYIKWLFGKIHDVYYREWLLKFMAHMVQKPGVKIRSCPLIWSEATGTGKSTMLSTVPRELVGREYHHEVDYGALEEKFNGFLLNTWHITLAEFKAGTKGERVAIAQKLKPWITDDQISVRAMRTDATTVANRFVLTATSNEADAAPIDENDRRWGVYELLTRPIGADEISEIIVGFFNGPRARGVLGTYFRNMSLAGFNPDMRPPATQARQAMIEATLSPYEEVLREAIDERRGPFTRDVFEISDLYEYLRRRVGFSPTQHMLARQLRRRGAQMRRVAYAGRAVRLWITRNIDRWQLASPADIIKHVEGDAIDILN